MTSLKDELLTAFESYRTACSSADESAFEKASSRHSFASMRNSVLSTGMEFSEALKQMAEFAEFLPSAADLENADVIENGPTAGVFACVVSTEEPGVECHLIRFVREDDGWKVDGNFSTATDQSEAMTYEDVAANLPAEMHINGVIGEVPALVEKPDHVAVLDVMSYGYQTTVLINGHEQDRVKGGSFSGTIAGGLANGSNSIAIRIEPDDDSDPTPASVRIRAAADSEEGCRLVFEWKSSGQGEQAYEGTFDV